MVFIFTRLTDDTTIEIIRWLLYYNKPFFRLNRVQDLSRLPASSDKTSQDYGRNFLGVDYNAIGSCYLNGRTMLALPSGEMNKDLRKQTQDILDNDAQKILGCLLEGLKEKRSFGNPPFNDSRLSKLSVLDAAKRIGLDIPKTAIVSARSQLIQLQQDWGRIITKTMDQSISVFTEEVIIDGQCTQEITEDTIAKMADHFYPSLIQQLVEKVFEIRAFFFRDMVYAIAIFSQADQRTVIDWRRNQTTVITRQVPFELPADLKQNIRLLMTDLKLNYGSADLIFTKEGRYVFLEINPYGQYGFLSAAGNFYIEKQIAEYL